nr:MAG TPA: hypothetical protein [Caudoviricetes sp.]
MRRRFFIKSLLKINGHPRLKFFLLYYYKKV